MLEPIFSVIKPDPKPKIGLLLKDCGIECTHSGNCGIAKQDGIQASIDGYADRVLWFETTGARSVIAPIGGIALGVDQGELEESLTVEGLSVDRHLSGVVEGRGNRIRL